MKHPARLALLLVCFALGGAGACLVIAVSSAWLEGVGLTVVAAGAMGAQWVVGMGE